MGLAFSWQRGDNQRPEAALCAFVRKPPEEAAAVFTSAGAQWFWACSWVLEAVPDIQPSSKPLLRDQETETQKDSPLNLSGVTQPEKPELDVLCSCPQRDLPKKAIMVILS